MWCFFLLLLENTLDTVIEMILFTTFVNSKDIWVVILRYEMQCFCVSLHNMLPILQCDEFFFFFWLLHENETLLSYLMLWYKMFSKADDTSRTVYHDWYLRVKYMYMLLANTSVESSILLFISPLSDIVNISCIDNELGFNSSKVL